MSNSAALNTNQAVAFPFESYQSKCSQNKIPLTVALSAIIILGATLAFLGHFGVLDHSFVYIGICISVISLIALSSLYISRRNELESAINAVRSFAELKAIVDTIDKVHDQCCNCGCDTALVITSSRLGGNISSHDLERKINDMLEYPKVLLDAPEKQFAQQVCKYLDARYSALHSNETAPDLSKYL